MSKSIGIIVGSLRKESYNMKLAKYIVDRYRDLANFKIIEIGDMPLFNEDLEDDLPKSVWKARREIEDKDGIIFITPEYNYSISGVLKNALDWFSRDDYVLMRKPYIVMGASNGSIGTTRAQSDLRKILNSGAFKMYSLSGNEFLFARIQDKMNEDGDLIDEGTIKRLDKRIDEFIKFISLIEKL